MSVIWTRPAALDLESIADYMARQNPRAARRTVQRISIRTWDLASHPYLGRPGRVADTRELVVTSTPFIVAYRIAEDRAEILAVFHGARIWPVLSPCPTLRRHDARTFIRPISARLCI